MQRGHPYLTRELDEQRAEQRRALRSIPDWLVDPSRYGPQARVKKVDDSDRALLETLVRRLAAEEIEALQPQLDTWRTELESDRLADFITNGTLERDRRQHGVVDARADLCKTINDRRPVRSRPAALPDELGTPMARCVTLLALAEELADDDYVDQRLAD